METARRAAVNALARHKPDRVERCKVAGGETSAVAGKGGFDKSSRQDPPRKETQRCKKKAMPYVLELQRRRSENNSLSAKGKKAGRVGLESRKEKTSRPRPLGVRGAAREHL